jgi:hypothetical protein
MRNTYTKSTEVLADILANPVCKDMLLDIGSKFLPKLQIPLWMSLES